MVLRAGMIRRPAREMRKGLARTRGEATADEDDADFFSVAIAADGADADPADEPRRWRETGAILCARACVWCASGEKNDFNKRGGEKEDEGGGQHSQTRIAANPEPWGGA
jgi:hypothetical protein